MPTLILQNTYSVIYSKLSYFIALPEKSYAALCVLLEMPVSISNQIEQSIGAVAAANGQIGNALAGMSTKNVASIVAAQDNTQGK